MSVDPPPDSAPGPPARRWFTLAEEDLAAARVLLERGDVALRVACFLAQQAAEKALKAGLIAQGLEFPRIHDLSGLYDRIPDFPGVTIDRDDLDLIDPWIIDGRYAADLPSVTSDEATAVVEAAARVVTALRGLVEQSRG